MIISLILIIKFKILSTIILTFNTINSRYYITIDYKEQLSILYYKFSIYIIMFSSFTNILTFNSHNNYYYNSDNNMIHTYS